ncbi:alpha/beta hydrolase family protein [Chitinophaga agri]|uniref:S9 family peptidase n=1 Tax=Chitinophaga agri TaxID=2703787 RepID=A0A6B9ZIY4_9BACT|nr:prolyl oligopeptidase family serine peptidase [Chitinophaga agri]QHS61045.1 S9 family peptidase [Chitinophaga agri]
MKICLLLRRIGLRKIVTACFSFFSISSLAQKTPLNNQSYENWDALVNYDISNDGKFVWYNHGSLSEGISVVVKSVVDSFSVTYPFIIGDPKFTADSKYAIFLTADTLNVLKLSNFNRRKIIKVSSFSVTTEGGPQFLSYRSDGRIYLHDLARGRTFDFNEGKVSLFNSQGTVMLIVGDSSLDWVDLSTLKVSRIIHGKISGNPVFDKNGTGIVFCPIINGVKSLFYYKSDFWKPVELIGGEKYLKDGRELSFRAPYFSKDSKKIFFGLIMQMNSHVRDDWDRNFFLKPTLKLWHYKDDFMQSTLSGMAQNRSVEVFAAVGVESKNVIILEKPDSTSVIGGNGIGNEFVITNTIGNSGEQNWNSYKKKYELISVMTGESKEIISDGPVYTMPPKLSSKEAFVSWYDYHVGNYFTYEIANGKIRCITSDIPSQLGAGIDETYADLAGSTYGYFWLADDRGLLVYDQYDIWQVDPYGLKSPINITGGIGQKNKIIFRLAANEYAYPSPKIGDTLLLATFDTETKRNGLCRVMVGKENKPDITHMSDGIYYFPWLFVERTPKEPIRAKYGNTYILQYMSTSFAPNICVTRDFKKFKILSNIRPQGNYNWMTAKLVKWNLNNGRELHGILYKPEDFDSTKKYPIIFHYYEKLSYQLNLFRTPEPSPGALNIAWYVSNGYLVFLPDVYIPPGRPAKGIVESVTSSIKKLKEFQWIDTNRMGLEGHSFGGYETYVLMTNTNHFAAAQASAGVSDFISGYSSLGGNFAHLYEVGQNNMRTTPWESPDLYIENSPIFKVANVKTPLLIMHNKDDGAVDFAQALEMYVALRRQKKPVWLLQYEGEGHTLDNPDNILDFALRQQQFFSYYLKNNLFPQWMKQPGISNFRRNPLGNETK